MKKKDNGPIRIRTQDKVINYTVINHRDITKTNMIRHAYETDEYLYKTSENKKGCFLGIADFCCTNFYLYAAYWHPNG